jgi:hypothetical protein
VGALNGHLAFSLDFTDLGTEFIAKNNVNKIKLAHNWSENLSLGVFLIE